MRKRHALRRRSGVEPLERRLFLSGSVNVLTHHGDAANDGANLAETVLTPADVNAADFGTRFSTALDGGVVTAQPIYLENVNITTGSSPGLHSVVYAATEADGLFAVDANTGTILWHDSFLDITDPTNLTPTTGVGPIRSSDINGNTDVGNNVGIVATPAVDTSSNEMFVTTNTRETRGSDTHFVQRLWAINCSSGAAVTAPAVIGDTIADAGILGNFSYVSGPIINGTGNNNPANPAAPTYPNTDRWLSAPGGQSGSVIAFNAILQMERPAVTLVNGTLYLAFASHGDDGPYYGWVLGYAESNLALTAVFNAIPTFSTNVDSSQPYIAEAGIWMSGADIATDGTYLYVTTGNGAFNGAASNFDANGFPIDHDYGDAVIKLAVDPTSSATNQNGNGWGLKVADFFVPSNQYELNAIDLDLGSGGVTLLPNTLLDAAGNPMLMVGGKESRIYLLDRTNLGKFNPSYPQGSSADPRLYDHVLGEYANNGVNGSGKQVYSSAAYLNGNVYFGLNASPGLEFSVATFASPTSPPGTSYVPPVTKTALSLGYPGATWQVTANGSTNGIVWAVNPGGADLIAYNASSFNTPIYDSNTNTADKLVGGSVKFELPLIVNGMAYVGTQTGYLMGYGLNSTYLASAGAFGAPTGLSAAFATAADARLSWTSNSTAATEFRIDRSTDGTNFTTIGYAPNPGTSAVTYDDTTVSPYTSYYYRVTAVSGSNVTPTSSVASYAPPLVLSGQNLYLAEDADGQHLDVWYNSTGAGSPDASLLLTQISQTSPVLVNGSAGNDSLTVSFANGDPLPAAGLTFAGSTGHNTLTLVGGGDTFTVNAGNVAVSGGFGSTSFACSTLTNLVIDGSVGANTIRQLAQPSVNLSLVNTTTNDVLSVNSGSFTLTAPAVSSGSQAVTLGGLSVAAGSTVTFAPASDHGTRGVLNLGTLGLAVTAGVYSARLDLTGNDLVLASGSIATLTAEVAQGLNLKSGAPWSGDGITSSTAAADPTHLSALGAVVNNDGSGNRLFGSGAPAGAFDGINAPLNSLLVRFTEFGDANLDGKIDGSDYSLLDAAYVADLPNGGRSPITGWLGGDFNYDGVIDGSDYTLLDNAFNNLAAEPVSQLAIGSAAQSITAGAYSSGIVVGLEDALGTTATAPAGGETVSLSTTSAGGTFYSTSLSPITSVVIPAGGSSATVIYADTVAGSPTLIFSSPGLGSAGQTETVQPAATYTPMQLTVRPQGPLTYTVGTTSNLFYAGLATPQGVGAVAPAGGLTITLTTSSPTGAFYTQANGGTPVASVVVPATQSQTFFYYGDSTPGTPVLTLTAAGLGAAAEQLLVAGPAAKLGVTTAARSPNVNTASAPITVTLEDAAGNPVVAPSAVTVNLSSSSTGGSFLNTSFGAVTGVTIPAGSSSVTIVYKDTTAGTPTITVAAPGLAAGTQKQTVTAAYSLPAGTVAFYSFENPANLYADSSGNNNNLKLGAGSVVFDPGAAAGHNGSALFSSGGSLQTSSGAFPTGVPTGSAAYTIAAWIDVNSLQKNGIVGWGNYGTNEQVNAFRTTQGDSAPDAYGLDNYWWANDDVVTTPNDLLNNWVYVAVTSNGTGTRTMYINGVAIGTFSGSGQAAATNFHVGVTNSSEFFNGRMSDLLIANAAFSQTQIAALYAEA
jgi:hypothetical protein